MTWRDLIANLGEYMTFTETWSRRHTQERFSPRHILTSFYLTFTDGEAMSLDKWVFNTKAHPVRQQ
ncbi:hypothetical protein RI367_007464 [Sorochytrium milnesiophthora]